MTPHMEDFNSNMREVDRLAEIHAEVTQPGPGRKHKVEILHKSSIVLLVACWEAYVEDLARNGLETILSESADPSTIPTDVRGRISDRLHGNRAWELAGDGWKKACQDHLKEVLRQTIGSLNTPKAKQVNELFLKVLGLSEMSGTWSWKGRKASQSVEQLDNLIALRGSIAHRVSTAASVQKMDVEIAREFIARLAVRSHNSVNEHLAGLLGKRPWSASSYAGTR